MRITRVRDRRYRRKVTREAGFAAVAKRTLNPGSLDAARADRRVLDLRRNSAITTSAASLCRQDSGLLPWRMPGFARGQEQFRIGLLQPFQQVLPQRVEDGNSGQFLPGRKRVLRGNGMGHQTGGLREGSNRNIALAHAPQEGGLEGGRSGILWI